MENLVLDCVVGVDWFEVIRRTPSVEFALSSSYGQFPLQEFKELDKDDIHVKELLDSLPSSQHADGGALLNAIIVDQQIPSTSASAWQRDASPAISYTSGTSVGVHLFSGSNNHVFPQLQITLNNFGSTIDNATMQDLPPSTNRGDQLNATILNQQVPPTSVPAWQRDECLAISYTSGTSVDLQLSGSSSQQLPINPNSLGSIVGDATIKDLQHSVNGGVELNEALANEQVPTTVSDWQTDASPITSSAPETCADVPALLANSRNVSDNKLEGAEEKCKDNHPGAAKIFRKRVSDRKSQRRLREKKKDAFSETDDVMCAAVHILHNLWIDEGVDSPQVNIAWETLKGRLVGSEKTRSLLASHARNHGCKLGSYLPEIYSDALRTRKIGRSSSMVRIASQEHLRKKKTCTKSQTMKS